MFSASMHIGDYKISSYAQEEVHNAANEISEALQDFRIEKILELLSDDELYILNKKISMEKMKRIKEIK